MDEVDMVVPRNCVNDMVVYLHNLQKEKDIRIKALVMREVEIFMRIFER